MYKLLATRVFQESLAYELLQQDRCLLKKKKKASNDQKGFKALVKRSRI